MDGIDTKLLNLVQRDGCLTVDQLASTVGLSASAVARRLKRLRADGIIAGQETVLSARVRDKQLTAVINVQLERHRPSDWQLMKRVLVDDPEVQTCYETSGTSDVLLIVATRDMASFNDFADRLSEMPLVRRYETTFVKRQVKSTLAIQL